MQFKSNAGADFSGRYTPKPHWLSGIRWPDDLIATRNRRPMTINRIPLIKGDWHSRLDREFVQFDRGAYVEYDPNDHTLDAMRYTMGVYPVRNKRRYRKSWLKLLYGMFRPRARYTMLAPILCAFLAVAGVSFVAGMLTTILLSL